jgi:hypothetical protein
VKCRDFQIDTVADSYPKVDSQMWKLLKTEEREGIVGYRYHRSTGLLQKKAAYKTARGG